MIGLGQVDYTYTQDGGMTVATPVGPHGTSIITYLDAPDASPGGGGSGAPGVAAGTGSGVGTGTGTGAGAGDWLSSIWCSLFPATCAPDGKPASSMLLWIVGGVVVLLVLTGGKRRR